VSACSPIHGACERHWRVGGLRLSETRHEARTKIAGHAHAWGSICFVVRGGFVERFGPRALSCEGLSVVWRSASVEHDNEIGAIGASCFNIEVPEALLDDVSTPFPYASVAGGAGTWKAAYLLADARDATPKDSLAVEARVVELVDALRPSKIVPAPRHVRKATELLRADVSEPWSLSGLASAVDIHPMHLTREFRRTHGQSIGQYVRRLRVELASRELARTDRSLSEVALSSGFADLPHLTRIFRRLTGMTPGRYRATLRY
jgi:AraC family transcriptional regulator